MERRRVVVTGLGTVNPLGNSVAESWAGVRAGKCGIGPIQAFDTEGFRVKLAAEVKDFHPEKWIDRRELKHIDRFAQFALAAAEEALRMSGLLAEGTGEKGKPEFSEKALETYAKERIGTIVSSGIGGLGIIEAEHEKALTKGYDRVSPFFIPTVISNMASANIAIRYGLQGLCSCPVTACAGGTNAIGDAFHRIRDGYEDVMVAGGAEAVISPLGIGGFSSMRALCESEDPLRASIPFDRERSGFVMGEGAGVLVLEERESAIRRGAEILAEIVGYGVSCDAYHITSPSPDGSGAARCMENAVSDAGIARESVGYINAHGTSTSLNDAGETAAIRRVFGAHADHLPVSSTKSMTGHLLGAAGGVEAVFTVMALRDQYLPATIHYREPDPACDLDYVPNQGREAELRYAMSNSLGFGGHNASIVLAAVQGEKQGEQK